MGDQTKSHDLLNADHLKADLKGRSVRGSFWTFSSQGMTFVLQSVYTVVLARLLAPADFGLVAMVFAVTGLGQAFADLGLSEATIQRQNITLDQVSTLFWLNTAIGFFLMLIMMALAPVLVWFYHEPRLLKLTFLMSLTFLMGGLRVQHNALLQRQMRFSDMAIRDVTAYASATIVAISLAFLGVGYWAIAAFPLVMNMTGLLVSWGMVRWVPGLPRRNAGVGSMVSFGGKVALSYLTSYLTYNTDNVLIGWYWGATPLGLYSRAYNLLMLPVRQLNAPIGRVAMPAFSRLKDDPETFARYYLRATSFMIWVAMPIFGFLFAAAHPVIILVLGRKWSEAAGVFQILCIAALAQLLLVPGTWIFVGRGLSGRLSRLTFTTCPIIIVTYLIGLPFGIKMVALLGSIGFVLILPWALSYTFRGTQLTLLRLAKAIIWPVSLSLAGAALGAIALHAVPFRSNVLQLMVVGAGFLVAYALGALLAPVREEMMSLKRLFGELRVKGQPIQAQAEAVETA
jgi:O-antigen/teichoic acid export membrane protein